MFKELTSSILGLFLTAGPALAQQDGYRYERGHMFSGDGWGYMFMGLILMIACIAVVILLVVLAFRWMSADHGEDSRQNRDAMAVLRERYARGEIDEKEFEERRQTLNRS